MIRQEPHPRFWHSAVSIRGKVYIRGGSTPRFDTDEGKRELLATIEEYDPVSQVWQQRTTTGELHPGISAVACTVSGDYMYAYGGSDGNYLYGVLSRLDITTLVWAQLSPYSFSGPMGKDASGMVYFSTNKLAVIGGYADPNGPIQQGSTLVLNEILNDGSGWTNEFHVFDLDKGSWSSPVIKGLRPPPCADFTLTSLAYNRAILYGGCRPPEGKRLDKDLYLIHFDVMEIIRIEWKQGDLWPVVTVGHHAACCLGFNKEHPQLLVTGGRSSQDEPLGYLWLFDVSQQKWKEVKLNTTPVARWGHTAASVSLCSNLEVAIIFGGTSANYQYGWGRLQTEDFPRLTETTIIKFEYSGSEGWLLSCNESCNGYNAWDNPTYTLPLRNKPYGLDDNVSAIQLVPLENAIQYQEVEAYNLRFLMFSSLIVCFIVLFLILLSVFF